MIEIAAGRRCLYVSVLSGKAFIELASPSLFTDTDADTVASDRVHTSVLPPPQQRCLGQTQEHNTYTLHIKYRAQKFTSQPVLAQCEPVFNQSFLFDQTTHTDTQSGSTHADTGLSTPAWTDSDAIHVVVVRTNTEGERVVVASHMVDWRVLVQHNVTHRETHCAIEVGGVGAYAGSTAGILHMRVDVLPLNDVTISDHVLMQERQARAERDRMFLTYAKTWWHEV
jgi:centrosomal protein CEP76